MTKRLDIPSLYRLFLETTGVCTDTRKIHKDCLYIALKGVSFDGNTFAHRAIELGAKYALIDDRSLADSSDALIFVADGLTALQELATHHRTVLDIPIVALTGSNGKTTTKELIHAVLGQQFNCVATSGNFNNHIGVPLTLLRMTKETQIGVVEMGANHQKEIEFLCQLALPNYGYITNFGKAHLEGFGSIEGVIKGKSEMIQHLRKAKGVMFVDPQNSKHIELTHGMDCVFLPTAEIIHTASSDHKLTLSLEGDTLSTQLIGYYNATNILAAIALGRYFGVPDGLIYEAVASYEPKMNRSQMLLKGPYTITMDAYNANPTSMSAALTHFGQQNNNQNRCVILGDMFELGTSAFEEHQAIVTQLKTLSIDTIYLVGTLFSGTDHHDDRFQVFATYADLEATLIKAPVTEPFILVKGSRAMALERLLERAL